MNSYEDRFRDDVLCGRFEFKQTGTIFEYDIKGYIKALIALVVALGVIFLFIFVFSRSYVIDLLTPAIIIIIALIWIGCAKMFVSSKQWHYVADNKKMVVSRKGTVRIYKYDEVIRVLYKEAPRGFKSLAGYTVTIEMKNGSIHKYDYISPQKGAMMSSEKTPFYILEHPPKPFNKDADYYNGR